MSKTIVFKLYYAIIPALVISVSLGYITLPLSLLALIPLLFMSNRHTIAIFFVMYGGALAGVIRAAYPYIPIYGQLLEWIGICLMWDIVVKLFRERSAAFFGILAVLIFFGLFYYLGPQTNFASVKYNTMWRHGLFMLVGYFAIDRSTKIDIEGLSRILVVGSIVMFAYVIHTVTMKSAGFFNYDWFRQQSFTFVHLSNNEGGLLVDYQHIGMMVLFSLAIYLSQLKIKLESAIFYTVCCLQLVLVSGCRQAILGVVLIIALRCVIFRPQYVSQNKQISNLIAKTIGIVVAFIVILFFFENIESVTISTTLNEGDQGRAMIYLEAISIFLDNQLMGCGIGGFNAITGEAWPHNLFLELLCETGLVGTIVLLSFLIITLIYKKQSLLHITESNQFFFLILTAIFVRVMFSADFRVSIELFSAILAISSARHVGKLYKLAK